MSQAIVSILYLDRGDALVSHAIVSILYLDRGEALLRGGAEG